MKPFLVLIIVFVLSLFSMRVYKHICDFSLAGRIAMAAMLILACIGHFKFPKGMSMMFPANIQYKLQLVYITGIIEICAAAGLLINNLYKTTGILLIIFFIVILPSNIYAAIKHVDIEKADYSGNGIKYLWFRIPLQLFFIAWIWYFTLYKG